MSHTTKSRLFSGGMVLIASALLFQSAAGPASAAVQADENVVITTQSVQWIEGNQRVVPFGGTGGTGNKFNYIQYNLPGELVQPGKPFTNSNNLPDISPGGIEGQEFYVAYANQNQPVQTTDWWTGVGLQWHGWTPPVDLANPVVRTQSFINEPFHYQFLDLPISQTITGLDLPVQGLRFWNPVEMRVFTGVITKPLVYADNLFGRGDISDQRSAVVTLGLKDVHPISDNTPLTPTAKPWTNIRIQSYSDWGVKMSYATGPNELTFSMANGSPFTWAERTKGTAPFRVWAGTDAADQNGRLTVWYNQDGKLGLTVANSYVAPGEGNPTITSTAAYAIYADTGAWSEQQSGNPNAHTSLFSNDAASKVVVAALPHNVSLTDTAALIATLTDLEPYAWQRIVNTQVSYPPISGSKLTVTVGGAVKPLGYDQANSVIRSLMEVTTEDFKTGSTPGAAMQIVFPHQRKKMVAQDKANIPLVNGAPKYTWRSVKGELHAYIGNSTVSELRTYGILPYLPNITVNSTASVNGNVPAEDIYDTLKQWFYKAEPTLGGNPGPFARNIGTYFPFQNNTYAPNLAGVYENMVIADQLAKSPNLAETDPEITRTTKTQVAGEMRDFMLSSLKEMIGRWGDVYTAGFFQYNPDFDTIYGFPEGYGSVQNLNDKHFHWSYFLRSAAAIGRFDLPWLQSHLPLINELRADVANYDRTSLRYPFLRNFSPFYGHSWANGTGNGGAGQDQESTSEAINFAVGLIELGQVLGNNEWRDMGLYLYEEEINAVEQYWFNQDGDPTQNSGTFYNGNWPDEFVRYEVGGRAHTNPYIGQVFQHFGTRGTFFGSPDFPGFANALLIQAIPLGAPALYLGRNQTWLQNAWNEFAAESLEYRNDTAYEVIVAGIQARLPGTGSTVLDAGFNGAMARINRQHALFPGALNSQGKHWAYTLNQMGQVDTSVVADVPNYGVFCKGATGADCAGGVRTFVAFYPTTNTLASPITVTFKLATTGAVVHAMTVEAGSTVAQTGNGPISAYQPFQIFAGSSRLYLRKPTMVSPTCDALAISSAMSLTEQPGSWTPAVGQSAYPTDTRALADSLVCVPARPDTNGTNVPPDAPFVRTWMGTFFGTYNGVIGSTQYNIFSNQSLVPGWQLDPCLQGGTAPSLPESCSSFGLNPTNGPGANAFVMQVSYDFDGDGVYERIEQYRNQSLSIGNSWTYENKQTHYKFDQQWPFDPPPMVLGGPDGSKTAPFPRVVKFDAAKPATIKVELYGGTITGGVKAQYPVPVSVNAAPSTDRASWIQTPYSSALGGPGPETLYYFPWIARD